MKIICVCQSSIFGVGGTLLQRFSWKCPIPNFCTWRLPFPLRNLCGIILHWYRWCIDIRDHSESSQGTYSQSIWLKEFTPVRNTDNCALLLLFINSSASMLFHLVNSNLPGQSGSFPFLHPVATFLNCHVHQQNNLNNKQQSRWRWGSWTLNMQHDFSIAYGII